MRYCTRSILRDCNVCIDWLKRNLRLFVFCFPIYLLNRIFKSYVKIPVLGYICQCHLNDYIGGIVFCIYLNVLLILNKRTPVVSLFPLCGIMICVSLMWEYFFPLMLPYSTSDAWDVVAYMLGTITYYLFIKHPIGHNSQKN